MQAWQHGRHGIHFRSSPPKYSQSFSSKRGPCAYSCFWSSERDLILINPGRNTATGSVYRARPGEQSTETNISHRNRIGRLASYDSGQHEHDSEHGAIHRRGHRNEQHCGDVELGSSINRWRGVHRNRECAGNNSDHRVRHHDLHCPHSCSCESVRRRRDRHVQRRQHHDGSGARECAHHRYRFSGHRYHRPRRESPIHGDR